MLYLTALGLKHIAKALQNLVTCTAFGKSSIFVGIAFIIVVVIIIIIVNNFIIIKYYYILKTPTASS